MPDKALWMILPWVHVSASPEQGANHQASFSPHAGGAQAADLKVRTHPLPPLCKREQSEIFDFDGGIVD